MSSCDDSELKYDALVANLAAEVTAVPVNRFNVSRSHVWDSARRGIQRKTFRGTNGMLIKFMDDVGNPEGAIDHGGPRREFLQLLMDHLSSDSCLFLGPPTARHLSNISSGTS